MRNPRVNVGRGSLLGTGASTILYLATAAVVMGLVPHHEPAGGTAPFVTAFETISLTASGPGSWWPRSRWSPGSAR